MLSSVITYPLLLLTLKYKLKSSRNSQEDMRLTIQIALSVGIEVIFFLMWELGPRYGALWIIVSMVSDLWYNNAVTLPYFIMNKKLHESFKLLLRCQNCNAEVSVLARKNPIFHTCSPTCHNGVKSIRRLHVLRGHRRVTAVIAHLR
ncbi:hypothetical protein KIN20_013763 [Parelaphostrongylus tenuis]|uniref:Uncharacterized protein n=1 Tax=Parelaphostrongylus tenuis TaxID=148309 RepID=A0AAD5MCL0_PARTN|nr:hypothetical protein KIN20_013763 [Parelaphostrongylus tenuis]